MNKKRVTLTQEEYTELEKLATPGCQGCATYLEVLKRYTRTKAGRKPITGKPLSNTEKVRRYRQKKRQSIKRATDTGSHDKTTK